MFVLVAVAVGADDLISPDSTLIRGIVISYYIATEALSVIENALQCGLPVPGKLKSIFEVMKSKNDTEDKKDE
jgi:phage-related holin